MAAFWTKSACFEPASLGVNAGAIGNSLESFAGCGLRDPPVNLVFFASKKLVWICMAACAFALACSRPASGSVSGALSGKLAILGVTDDVQRSDIEMPAEGLFLLVFGDAKANLGEFRDENGS